MKKIVALVLSLVMALSLCTMAFAAVKNVAYGVDAKHNVDKTNENIATFSLVKAHSYKDGTGYVEYYEAEWDGNKDTVEAYWIPCEQADAQLAIYKNGSFVTWVYEIPAANANVNADGVPAAAIYYDVAKVQKATTAKPNCTTSQFFEDGYLSDGHFYIDGGTYQINVNGKIVKVTDVCEDTNFVVWASHIFAKGVKNDKTGYDVATCLICKGEFATTNDEAVATKNGYKISTGFSYVSDDAENVYDENAYANGYDFSWGQTYAGDYEFCWQLKAGTTEEIGTKPDSNKGVDSAKTFDAGIAMYVGMSLLSVAGSAVVIGKKKEF